MGKPKVKGRKWEREIRIGRFSVQIYFYSDSWFGISFDWYLTDKDAKT